MSLIIQEAPLIEESLLKDSAKKIVECINLKKGECVYIRGNTCFNDIIEEVGLEILRNGGFPFTHLRGDRYWEAMLFDEIIPITMLEETPRCLRALIENIDALINFEYIEDLEMRSKAPRNRVESLQKPHYAIDDILKGGKKRLYVGWPTSKLAQCYNVDYEKYKRLLIGGINVPHITLEYKAHLLITKFFKNVEKIYVSDDNGTDFYVNVKGRHIGSDTGFISDEDLEKGLITANLPAGEIVYPPIEIEGDGVLVCPIIQDFDSKKLVHNLILPFKKGRLLMDELTADNDVDKIIATFSHFEELDREKGITEIRTYNVAEFAMGINPAIDEVIGRIITDEKISGTVHLAFGGNDSWGGTSNSNLHIDFVTAPKENITVQYGNGTKRQVMEQGKWIID